MRNQSTSNIIRVVAGGYLLYLAYQLITSLRTENVDNKGWLIAASVLFVVSGIGILALGIKGMIDLSKVDPDEEADANLNEELEAEEEVYGMYAEPGLTKGKVANITQELERLKAEDDNEVKGEEKNTDKIAEKNGENIK